METTKNLDKATPESKAAIDDMTARLNACKEKVEKIITDAGFSCMGVLQCYSHVNGQNLTSGTEISVIKEGYSVIESTSEGLNKRKTEGMSSEELLVKCVESSSLGQILDAHISNLQGLSLGLKRFSREAYNKTKGITEEQECDCPICSIARMMNKQPAHTTPMGKGGEA